MIYDIVSACASGLDLLTVYLLACGFSQREAAAMLSTTEPVISRRMKRIYKSYMEGLKK